MLARLCEWLFGLRAQFPPAGPMQQLLHRMPHVRIHTAAVGAVRMQRAHHLLQPLELRVQLLPQSVQLTLPMAILHTDALQIGIYRLQVLLQQPPRGLHFTKLEADLGQMLPRSLTLLLVPALLVIVDGEQRFDITLQSVVGYCHLGQPPLHQTHVLHHMGKTLKVGIRVVLGHAGVGLNGVLF